MGLLMGKIQLKCSSLLIFLIGLLKQSWSFFFNHYVFTWFFLSTTWPPHPLLLFQKSHVLTTIFSLESTHWKLGDCATDEALCNTVCGFFSQHWMPDSVLVILVETGKVVLPMFQIHLLYTSTVPGLIKSVLAQRKVACAEIRKGFCIPQALGSCYGIHSVSVEYLLRAGHCLDRRKDTLPTRGQPVLSW